jgi:two-component system chemotaxis response regulator CheB
MSIEKIKVLVVDDSALMRKMISDILNADNRIEVVGTAQNGKIALSKLEKLKPDIMTLDIDMPGMDGYTLLNKIMQNEPIPVIILSGLAQEGTALSVKCLEAGAVDVIPKPLATFCRDINPVAKDLIRSIISISRSQVRLTLKSPKKSIAIKKAVPPKKEIRKDFGNEIIAIGISTGGPAALGKIFPEFPEKTPPILLVQHMPPKFTKSLAERLDSISKITVKEAEEGEIVNKNTAYIAPGNFHMAVKATGNSLKIVLNQEDKIHGVRPAVDVLFKSLAECCGAKVKAVIMTGMGSDGVSGLKDIQGKGGVTFAQDEKSCVVYGMPKVAVREGCVDEEIKLDEIVQRLIY